MDKPTTQTLECHLETLKSLSAELRDCLSSARAARDREEANCRELEARQANCQAAIGAVENLILSSPFREI